MNLIFAPMVESIQSVENKVLRRIRTFSIEFRDCRDSRDHFSETTPFVSTPSVPQNIHIIIFQGQILAVWILAVKLPNSDLIFFCVDFWVDFSSRFF